MTYIKKNVTSYVIFSAVFIILYFSINVSLTNVFATESGSGSDNLNIGNNTIMPSDSFFQLDDSIEQIKILVNDTNIAIDTNNSTEAKNLLNEIYEELIQISNNANNLIWDISNQGET